MKKNFMRKLFNKLRRLFCRHNYIPWASVDEELSQEYFNGKVRTVYICTKCRKRKYSKKEVPAPLNYSDILDMMYLVNYMGVNVDTAVNVIMHRNKEDL